MSTVLMIGSRSPALTSLASVIRSLDCYVFEAPTAGRHGQFIRFDLIAAEFRPPDSGSQATRVQATASEQLLAALPPLDAPGSLPLLLTGPELPARQRAQLEASRPGTVYLHANSAPGRKAEAVRALLPGVSSPSLRVGPLQLNTAEGVARYGQHSLPLTSTEFKLLHSLMKRPGQMIDCDTLGALSQCQDVPTHVGNLRRKFSSWTAGGRSASPLLRGNRHQGYAIDARHHQRTLRNPGFALRDHLLHLL